jgi:succinyl-diaminopimelate desuccinylase
MDTVPEEWELTYRMVLSGDRYTGVGTTDMKSGLAVMLKMAEKYLHVRPECDLWLWFVREEETTGSGSRTLGRWWSENFSREYSYAGIVILEPTGGLYVAPGTRGGGRLIATAKGFEGHPAFTPVPRPITAPEAICRLGASLRRVEGQLRRWYESDRNYGYPSIQVTWLHTPHAGGNVVPGLAQVGVDVRTNDRLGPRQLQRVIHRLERSFGVSIPIAPNVGGVVESPQPQTMLAAFARAWPELEVGAFPGATDLQDLRDTTGWTVVVCGPGDESLHQGTGEGIRMGAMEYFFDNICNVLTAVAQS